MSRTSSGASAISVIPPALSAIGPKVSHGQDVGRAHQHAHRADGRAEHAGLKVADGDSKVSKPLNAGLERCPERH